MLTLVSLLLSLLLCTVKAVSEIQGALGTVCGARWLPVQPGRPATVLVQPPNDVFFVCFVRRLPKSSFFNTCRWIARIQLLHHRQQQQQQQLVLGI
jgi:hypothetical protein